MNLLKKVLWQNRSLWQLIGASIGVFVGLFLLLFALQFYLDIQKLMKGARDENILVINKVTTVLNTFGVDNSFTAEEIADIRQQPFFKDVGEFTSSGFKAALAANSLNLYTLIFFQSVPNRFLDIDTAGFHWKEGQKIPIVMSSDYLALYNFGFAPSQGLPQFTVSTIGLLTADVYIDGKQPRKILEGSVYGLSRNVNTFLVPQEFMDYANANWAVEQKPTTQLIVSTDNPYNKALNDYLTQKGYEISRGGLIGGELKSTLDILILLVMVIGIILIGLSILVFVLNFQLLIAQASQDIKLLIQIGYNYGRITRVLSRNLIFIFTIIAVLAFGALIPLKYYLSKSLIAQGYDYLSTSIHPLVWAVGLSFCTVFVLINWQSIRSSVKRVA